MSETVNKKTEKMGFEAEVSRLLHMMVHSVYSDREIFLRELVSNASDACDKLRYGVLTDASLKTDGNDFGIAIVADAEAKTITVSDNGIGMNRDDLIANLGTIARSGTANFVDQLTGDSKKDVQLIGQFGVGFYSVFMVAGDVSVTTRKAGEDTAWRWISKGEGSYEIEEASKEHQGTEIVLHIKDDAAEFLEQHRLSNIVTTYSDHIEVPITLAIKGKEEADAEAKIVNEGSAIWARPKSDITDEQYTEFYRHVGHAFDEPAHRLHYKVEGMQEYTVLLYVPTQKPMDLFDPARKNRVKLYVKKVFISDDSADILPGWLRFMRGVVDSQDLPLNVSREMLQNNPVVSRMSKAITKKVLGEFEKMAEKDAAKFENIWAEFGGVIKEGIYEDFERRDQILKLSRFKSTSAEGWTTLADYVSRMKDKQDKIYYITGTDEAALKRSPQLEGFKARGIEVLLLADAVDDFWLQMVPDFEGKGFASITRGTSDLDDIAGVEKKAEEQAPEGELTTLITLMKEVLGDKVSDVRASNRLTDTSSCLVASDTGMDMAMERMLKAHNQLDAVTAKVLEINPSHGLIRKLAKKAGEKGAMDTLADPVWLVLDQAKILEGDALDDAAAFARRLSAAMEAGLA
ncbi:molecular chaperone HtpG [Kordiimonas sp. SCSIO 12603]|uniref:molecular chaperone HtpG n=1 Tax=Kordiimonas sp. SCSIO 12603 TaxID=2829596 RepID=UPI002105FECD|nr:molecular chaperone HtpG [Kordiimonas sp. SCSIO 12603]UTW59439.1 molecular chaperone HtpG [Kordiimonas sp. SCSIO 12603]